MDTKEKLSKYWVHSINSLLGKLKLDKINPETFTNLMVQNTAEILTITVICTEKMLVLNLNNETQKVTGGWKEF